MTSRSKQIKEATAKMAKDQEEAAARDSAKDQVVASKEQAIVTLTRDLAAARGQCEEGRNRSHLLASHEKTMLESILDCEQQVHILHKSLVHAEAEGKRLEMEMMQLEVNEKDAKIATLINEKNTILDERLAQEKDMTEVWAISMRRVARANGSD